MSLPGFKTLSNCRKTAILVSTFKLKGRQHYVYKVLRMFGCRRLRFKFE